MELRIASLIPSASEICGALGIADQLVGRSHSCDFPPGVHSLPVLTETAIHVQRNSAEIDSEVQSLLSSGESIYRVREDELRDLNPNVILTQQACDLCAVSFPEVRRVVQRLGLDDTTQVISLSPETLDDVFTDILKVGAATGRADGAAELSESYRQRLRDLQRRSTPDTPPRLMVVEWIDPLIAGGHWIPELVEIAGAQSVLGSPGAHAPKISWDEVVDVNPEIIVFAPCGFRIEQSLVDLPKFFEQPGFDELAAAQNGHIFVADGHAYFNNPGPRLIDTAELLAAIVDYVAESQHDESSTNWEIRALDVASRSVYRVSLKQ